MGLCHYHQTSQPAASCGPCHCASALQEFRISNSKSVLAPEYARIKIIVSTLDEANASEAAIVNVSGLDRKAEIKMGLLKNNKR